MRIAVIGLATVALHNAGLDQIDSILIMLAFGLGVLLALAQDLKELFK